MLQGSGRTLATRSGIQKPGTLCTAGAQTQILPMTMTWAIEKTTKNQDGKYKTKESTGHEWQTTQVKSTLAPGTSNVQNFEMPKQSVTDDIKFANKGIERLTSTRPRTSTKRSRTRFLTLRLP